MKTVFFNEEQRVTSTWLWLLVGCLSTIYLFTLIEQVFFNKPIGNNPAPDLIIIAFGIIPLTLLVLLMKVKLVVTIDEDGCKFQFRPFHSKFKEINWNEIKRIYLRKYNPVFEYGGWGIRVLPFSKNIAYNIKGSYGIQIELKNGKKILLGTLQPEEVEKVLKQINFSKI